MRFPFPRSLPSWLLTILISGLLITQIATLWIVSQDRKEANYALELFRLSERATSLVKLLNTTPVSDWNSLASRLASSGQGLTITLQPDVPTVLASEEDLAELEDVLVARLARYGVIDARIRRDKLAHGPHATVVPTADSGDIGDVEKQINDLAATANLGASLTTSCNLAMGAGSILPRASPRLIQLSRPKPFHFSRLWRSAWFLSQYGQRDASPHLTVCWNMPSTASEAT